MPIPLLSPPREEPVASFQLVLSPGPKIPARLFSRSMAYAFDLLLVGGVSIYVAKIFSLLAVSAHMPAIHETGKMAGRLFRDAFSQGQFQLGIFFFAFLYMAYFVALPCLTGKTFGLGIFGLRLDSHFGPRPQVRSLLLRQLGCFCQFFTGGMMLLPILKGTNQPLIQDRLSATRVVLDR